MIRLSVLYSLPPGTDEAEFLRWRLGEHQQSNLAIPGVIRTDFARVVDAWPEGVRSPYRFLTTVEWPDRESFRQGFYDSSVQAKLGQDVEKIHGSLFLISEVLAPGPATAAGPLPSK